MEQPIRLLRKYLYAGNQTFKEHSSSGCAFRRRVLWGVQLNFFSQTQKAHHCRSSWNNCSKRDKSGFKLSIQSRDISSDLSHPTQLHQQLGSCVFWARIMLLFLVSIVINFIMLLLCIFVSLLQEIFSVSELFEDAESISQEERAAW